MFGHPPDTPSINFEFGLSISSRISPASPTRSSGIMSFQDEPGFQSDSCQVSHQYCRVNSGVARASRSFSGVARIQAT